MRIGIVSQWYPPEPVHIPATLAGELARRGHEVRVLTGLPTYPEGRLYPGYRQRWRNRTSAGQVTVRRVPLYPSHDGSGARRAVTYLSFAATSSAAATRFLAGVDAVYVYLTPATAAAAAAVARLVHRAPMVVHVQDLWPESVTASSMAPAGRAGRLLDRALHAAMRRLYQASAGIAVIAPSMRDIVVARGAAPERVRVVFNWADEAVFAPTAPATERLGLPGRCTIMYAGTMGPFQNVEDSVRAAAAVEHADAIDLVLVGSGTAERSARTLATQLRARNVHFLGRRGVRDMPALYAAADFQLITLRDLPIFRGTVPSKLQAAMACGSPVIVAVPGDAAALVENAGAGLACPPGDWRALADCFLRAAKLPAAERAETGQRARACYTATMSLRAGVDAVEEMLHDAARPRGRRRR